MTEKEPFRYPCGCGTYYFDPAYPGYVVQERCELHAVARADRGEELLPSQREVYAAIDAAIRRGRVCPLCGSQMLWKYQGITTVWWECVTKDWAEIEDVEDTARG